MRKPIILYEQNLGAGTLKDAEKLAKKLKLTKRSKHTIFDAGTHYRINYYIKL